ncbi:hypothetical protein P3T76_013738 [Phytophthora citrophthora]|uniref:Uncharacterized protein n=1 Tax=Phytophthora citrophthora TaxID=4793 RepID=A0AAD9G289_9STRA|nr:hypothetical protein P3T76_013738 [Phytophthora citrophthora]
MRNMRKSLAILKKVLQGYYVPDDLTQKALVDLFQVLNEPLLPVEEQGGHVIIGRPHPAGCIRENYGQT